MKKKTNWIAVVTGIICKQNHVLLGLRPNKGTLPGVWEFPGGKIELGESPEEALRRELFEELGIEAEIGSLTYATTHTYNGIGIILLFYQVKFWKGEPKSIHHSQLIWTQKENLPLLHLPEANKKALEPIIQAIGEL